MPSALDRWGAECPLSGKFVRCASRRGLIYRTAPESFTCGTNTLNLTRDVIHHPRQQKLVIASPLTATVMTRLLPMESGIHGCKRVLRSQAIFQPSNIGSSSVTRVKSPVLPNVVFAFVLARIHSSAESISVHRSALVSWGKPCKHLCSSQDVLFVASKQATRLGARLCACLHTCARSFGSLKYVVHFR